MNPELMAKIKVAALENRGWAMEESRKLVRRLQKFPKEEVIFETGYGPSGLPHIGTFGEVFRTSIVRFAFSLLSDIPSRLICFSDDMDGLRKVPDNVPNQELLRANLHKPLTQVPDPFGTAASFGEHNNRRLQDFLDNFGFEYEFVSSTETYKSGRFDSALLQVLENYDEILGIMLPSLGAERQATYSPFLPICEQSGHVLQVPLLDYDVKRGTILYRRDDGKEIESSVTGGACKLQWKPDWGMRWAALGVDYEMSGKDLSESVILSAKITKALGAIPPEGFSYELFLDQNGQKISKSKGNGLSIEEWLKYAPKESLSYFMYLKPKTAKRLYFDVIPKAVDESLQFLANTDSDDSSDENVKKMLANPLFFIRQGNIKCEKLPVSFALLLTLVNASNISDARTLAGFIKKYAPSASSESPLLQELMTYALHYYNDFVKPQKHYEALNENDRKAVIALQAALTCLPKEAWQDSEEVQRCVFAVAREFKYEPMRQWFSVLYQSLLGQDQGPRIGTLFAILGRQDSIELIESGLAR